MLVPLQFGEVAGQEIACITMICVFVPSPVFQKLLEFCKIPKGSRIVENGLFEACPSQVIVAQIRDMVFNVAWRGFHVSSAPIPTTAGRAPIRRHQQYALPRPSGGPFHLAQICNKDDFAR